MHKLQKLNVIKIVDNDNSKDKLITQGFKLMSETNNAKTIDYSALTVDKLKEIVKEKGLENYSTMKKEELVATLKEFDNVTAK